MKRHIVQKEVDNRRKTKLKLAAMVAVLIFSADRFTDNTGGAGNITYVLK